MATKTDLENQIKSTAIDKVRLRIKVEQFEFKIKLLEKEGDKLEAKGLELTKELMAMEKEAMKEDELRTHTKCSRCRKGIVHKGLPSFWTLTVNRYSLDMGAIIRNAELAAFLGGSAALAHVMGPDEDMAEEIMDTVTLTLCENCAMGLVIIPALCGEVKK
jgi:hypothetical protein